MGDEDRTEQQLPRRVKGVADARGRAASASSPMTSELRQRMQAAVKAERARVTGRDQEPPKPGPDRNRADHRADHSGADRNGTDQNGADHKGADHNRGVAPHVGQIGHVAGPDPPGQPGPAAQPRTAARPEPAARPGSAARPGPAAEAPIPGHQAALPGRAPRAAARKTASRRFRVATAAIGTALTLIAAGALGVAVARFVTSPTVHVPIVSPAQERADAAVRRVAAIWVTQQVSRGAVISCDPLMCAALTAHGFPSRDVRVLGPTSPYPVTSDVVIVTQAVRDLFGSSLSSDYAPAVLAAFGSGQASITVRVVAPRGPSAYRNQIGADQAARKDIGKDLLTITEITVSAEARRQLLAGQPDSRLLLAVAHLASKQAIDIVEFGNLAPGGDPTIPLRYADLAESDQAAHLGRSDYLRALRAGLASSEYRPTTIVSVSLPSGQSVLRIEFAAPSVLGLVGPQPPS